MQLAVQVGTQAGKKILTGVISAAEVVDELRNGAITVNPEAQRSLAKGAGKATTTELLEGERVHNTPRMKSIVKFYRRVMANVEQANNSEGFLGAVQLVVPDTFTGSKFLPVKVSDDMKEQSASLSRYLEAIGSAGAGTFVANPRHGQAVLDTVDGQAREFGFYSFEKAVVEQIDALRRVIAKKQKVYQPINEEQAQVAELEALLDRIRRFLTENHISFVIYVDSIQADGTIVGLPLTAERRAYIEGNALNAQAAKEEVIKYESFSPVVLELQTIRVEPKYRWMSEDYIEEDSKSISANSIKLFTLSTLVQAFSRSIIGSKEALKGIDEETFQMVAQRADFTRAFWARVSNVFVDLWIPDYDTPGERLDYLREKRGDEQNVAFQAIFLQALGKVGHSLGRAANWDPESPLFHKLDGLNHSLVDYRARNGSPPDGYNPIWTNAMMKPVTDPVTGAIERYVFNNVEDSITKTYHVLCNLIGLSADKEETFEEVAEEAAVA
jgi:hypothetical protein